MTIIEKIFSRAAGRDVRPGEYIWVSLNLIAMRDFGGPNVIQEYENAFHGHPVFDKERIAITFDLHIPARNEKVADNQRFCRDFARRQGVRLFDINTGVGQHILLESGLVKPWDIIVGTDSHMNLLGAVGAAGFGMGTTDIAGAMYKGKLYFRVPSTIHIKVTGELGRFVSAKDLILYILKTLKTDGALNCAVELSGVTIDKMNIAERITVASMITEMSGDIGFIQPSKEVMNYIKDRTVSKVEMIGPDRDAIYERTYEFKIGDLQPQIACPHSPDNVKDVKDVKNTKVDQVFIGSCTNGRYEDMYSAAQILKGKKVKPGLRLIVVPATMEVVKESLKHGLYNIFIDAGAVITNPGCALCTTGHPGILAPGEIMLSTSNRNFIGKLGQGAKVYLASPATAAATALTGVITDPNEV